MKPIVFFDGVCGLCNNFINFLFEVDTEQKFNVATLQGEVAKKYLTEDQVRDLDTVVVYVPSKNLRLTKSHAIFYVLGEVGGVWKVVSYLRFLPKFLTDFGYSMVARFRYVLFGKKETCRLPTPSERARFLN